MDLAARTPADIDIELDGLWQARARYESDRDTFARRALSYRERGLETHAAEYADKAQKAHSAAERARIDAEPLEAEYARRPWSRFWHVANTNGHIHSSMSCTTCFRSTRYAFRPELSGMTEAELVAVVGEVACTVCFPAAPTFKGFGDGTSALAKLTETEKAAKAAEKAAKQAAKDAKAITQRDGKPLREDAGKGYTIKTLASAKRELSSAIYYAIITEQCAREGYEAEKVAEAIYLADAIAAKIGSTPEAVLAEATKKARTKIRRDLRKYGHDIRTADRAVPGLPS